ncbi:MAGE family, partial [Geosmithia morbida]
MSGRRRMRDEADDEEDTRPRQRRHHDESDDAGDSESGGDDPDAGGEATRSADEQMAKKLVRYALSCEYSRATIRRDGIREKVLGSHGRSFRRVFTLAQKQLRLVWGMELRELPAREKVTLHEKRKGTRFLDPTGFLFLFTLIPDQRIAMSSNTQPKTGTGSYILCSTLPASLRSAAIIPPSRAPSHDDESTYVAFYTLVVSCIWLNGGELSEQKLRRYLVRLNADHNVSSEKTEAILKRMERQGYVVRRVDRQAAGGGGQDGDHNTTWHVGSRAKEEIGLDGVIGMVEEVFGGTSPELEKKLRASLGIRTAAGGSDGNDAANETGNGSTT